MFSIDANRTKIVLLIKFDAKLLILTLIKRSFQHVLQSLL